ILEKLVCTSPKHPLRPHIRHPRLFEADPRPQATHKQIALAKTEQMFDRLPVDQREVARIKWNFDLRKTLKSTVKRLVKHLHIPGSFPLDTYPVDHVIS